MSKQRQHRRVWSEKEDETLKRFVQQCQDPAKPKWKQISEKLNKILSLEFKRNPKQCRQRWYNSLASATQQSRQWSVQDDITLIQACKKYGHRWSRLVKQFDRQVNDNKLKNHFYSTVRRIVRAINALVKQTKKQYQKNLKNDQISLYTQDQQQIIKQINRMRVFQPKHLSKIFSLIDTKQQYKYEAKQSLQVEEVQSINQQVLNYMQDFVTGKNQFTNWRILEMVIRVLQVNRTIKTKYMREVKLSLQDDQDIIKQQQLKKKRQRKINHIVKEQLHNKIIPDKKMKQQVIEKIRRENKKLKRLIKPINIRRLRLRKNRKTQHKNQQNQQLQEVVQEKQEQCASQKNLIDIQLKHTDQNKDMKRTSKRIRQQQIKEQNLKIKKRQEIRKKREQQQLQKKRQTLLNRKQSNSSIRTPPGSLSLSSILNPQKRDNKLNKASSINFGKSQKNKKSPEQSIQSKILQSIVKLNQNNPNLKTKNQNGQFIFKDNPFKSLFLNQIPLLTSNQQSDKNNIGLKQLINPFFPNHKLTQSQGYFCFNHPSNQPNLQRDQHNLSRSHPILNNPAYNFENIEESKNSENQKKGAFQNFSQHNQRNPRTFESLLNSNNCQSNDKLSQHSQKMRGSLFDLIPNFLPPHTPLLFGPKENQNQLSRDNNFLQASHPYSTNFNDNAAPKTNQLQLKPFVIQIQRRNEIQVNRNANNMYGSFSFVNKPKQKKSKPKPKTPRKKK